MSQNEVQANPVIYSRKDYIMVLSDAQLAFATLVALRHAQIAAWKGDTEAREADLTRLIMARYTRHERHHYNRYLESLKAPAKLSWWAKMLGRKLVDKTDIYGSLEAYTSITNGTTFETYKEAEFARVKGYGYTDRVDALRWFASNANDFLRNEWEEPLETVTRILSEVEYGNFDAQFIIPREDFDNYASAMLKADSGKIDAVEGKIYTNREWY